MHCNNHFAINSLLYLAESEWECAVFIIFFSVILVYEQFWYACGNRVLGQDTDTVGYRTRRDGAHVRRTYRGYEYNSYTSRSFF